MNKKVSFHELAEFELNDAAAFFEITPLRFARTTKSRVRNWWPKLKDGSLV